MNRLGHPGSAHSNAASGDSSSNLLQQSSDSPSELREFLDAIPVHLWSAEPNGTIDFFNLYWFEFSGKNPSADPKGISLAELIHPDDWERVTETWNQAFATGSPVDQEFRLKRASDQEYRWHRSRGVPIRKLDGTIKRWAGYNSDIHDEKTALDDLKSERDLRETFVATLTHDLRTPLTAAKMSTALLNRMASDPVAIKRLAGRISSSIDRADKMIRDLLDANLIQAGNHLPLEVEPCDLAIIISETLTDLTTVHGDRFIFKIKGNDGIEVPGPVTGYWSNTGLRRVIENLCSNAIKYGLINRSVTVTLHLLGSRVRLEVHNEGTAIPSADQTVLFKPFVRAKAAQQGGQKGWGLGLTLVQGIVEAQGGVVSVESRAVLGTTFIVDLDLDCRASAAL